MSLKKTFRTLFIFMLTMITINMTYAQPNPCDCDFTFEVVCVDDGNGNIIPFPNACFAECEGFTAADFVDCDPILGTDTTIITDPCGCDFTDLTVVCVDDGNGGIIPFPNACFAECEGFTATDFVDCDFGGGIDTTIVIDTTTTTIDTCGCDFTLEFVCVTDSLGNVFPFPNACFAECAGFTAADFVNCDSIIFPPFDDCYASFWYDYDPASPLSVQFTDYSSTATSWAWDFGDGNTSTEQNPLHVYSEEGVYDVTLTITGDSCTNTITEHICIFDNGGGVIDTCGCGFEIEPVCVEDSLGNAIPFPNACWAECEGFTAADFVDCDFGGGIDTTIVTDPCGCGFEIEPVCVEDADGNVIPFPNSCWAECEGFTAADFVDCDFGGGIDTIDLCGCGFDIEPVCVEDGDGNIIPFPNSCLAECEGFTAADFVDCGFGIITDSIDLCGCGFEIEPVCVDDGNGDVLTFPNACWAECLGFTADDFVDCALFDITAPHEHQVNFSVANIFAYPNPAVNILNISLLSDVEQEYRFNIQNISGIRVSSSSQMVYKGKNTLQFDVSTLQTGMYFLEIQNGEEIQTVKFMK